MYETDGGYLQTVKNAIHFTDDPSFLGHPRKFPLLAPPKNLKIRNNSSEITPNIPVSLNALTEFLLYKIQ